MTTRSSARTGWLIWTTLLVVATLVLVGARDRIDQVHAVLTLLLIVLGGSVAGGRALGFTLACASFALIDYFFQPPFDLFSVNKPLDGVVLVAFLAAAGVTTDLLVRARQEAEAARERAREIESLSRLGAATLRHAEPADALNAIAELVRETIGANDCIIFELDEEGAVMPVAQSPVGDLPGDDDRARSAAVDAAERAAPVALAPDAGLSVVEAARFDDDRAPAITSRLLALPLTAAHRPIGVLVVRREPAMRLDAPRRRLLAALAYYAALGIERARLVAEAGHTQALREANVAKDQILASVSHDLRTPLTTIKALAQGAQSRGEASAPAIVEQADRLARLVTDLLELSRLRVGGLALHREINTAEDLIGAAIRRAEGVLDGKQVLPHVDLGSPALVGVFDFVQTLRIVGNLLDNALRYTPAGGTVDLYVARDADQLVITVADRGSGVEPAERERIFDAFYRPAGATPDSGHAGLGLSIARTLAELQGGTLEHAHRPGGGSEFILRLPAADVEIGAGAEAARLDAITDGPEDLESLPGGLDRASAPSSRSAPPGTPSRARRTPGDTPSDATPAARPAPA